MTARKAMRTSRKRAAAIVRAEERRIRSEVDWHFFGGRANVLALGDLEAVQRAIGKLMPEHDALRAFFTEQILGRRR